MYLFFFSHFFSGVSSTATNRQTAHDDDTIKQTQIKQTSGNRKREGERERGRGGAQSKCSRPHHRYSS